MTENKKAAGCGNSPTAHSYNMHGDYITQFRDAIGAAGITLPDVIEADGNLHRFRVDGDEPGEQAGWYCLHLNGRPAGVFGNWRTGQSVKWAANGERVTEAEHAKYAGVVAAEKAKADAERHARHEHVACHAASRWANAAPANAQHPYLIAKGVRAHGLRQAGRLLLVPLIDMHGRLWSLQEISPDGKKRYMPGGRAAGMFSPLGDLHNPECLLICEGWATGATLHEETGLPVLCAMNCYNLLAVAKAARAAWPDCELTIAGDDDRYTQGNPGRSKATEAALAVGARLVFPEFPEGVAGTDFNDMRRGRA